MKKTLPISILLFAFISFTYGQPFLRKSVNAWEENYSFTVADFNKDGFKDVITIKGSTKTKINLSINNKIKPTTFTSGVVMDSFNLIGSISSADIDGDGDVDLICSHNSDRELLFLKNKGNGTFVSQKTSFKGILGTIPIDLDNDGDADFVTRQYFPGLVKVITNNAGVYSEKTVYSGSSSVESIDVSDINGDNRPEIVVGFSAFSGEQVLLYEQLMNGNFFKRDISTDFEQLVDVGIADMNNDGKKEVVCVNRDNLRIWKFNANLSFTTSDYTADGATNYGFSLFDYNQDGFADIVLSKVFDTSILFTNKSTSSAYNFESASFSSLSGWYASNWTDIDNDGDYDFFMTNDDTAWSENQKPTDNDNDGFTADVDCNDADPSINPGAPEICDGKDNNCKDGVDEGLPLTTYYEDKDGDGFGNLTITKSTCQSTAPTGFVTTSTDCDDTNASINPNSNEICDNKDNNCNGQSDESLAVNTYYEDKDGDGFGNPSVTKSSCLATAPTGFVTTKTDCNDNDFLINPTRPEICDDKDNNCSGAIDEGLPVNTYYEDKDGDGFGSLVVLSSCKSAAPSGYATNNKDCNDNNAVVNPNGVDSSANGIDEDCSGSDFIVSTKDEYSRMITVSPNPASDYISINVPDNINITSQVYNQEGQLVIDNISTTVVNVSGLRSGVYFVQIMLDNNQKIYRKIVKK